MMIASTLIAATLAMQPAASASPMPPMAMEHDHASMTGKPAMAGKMEGCCKDGCACCGKKEEGDKAAPARR